MVRAEPRDLDFVDSAPVRVTAELTVDASAEVVFDVLADAPGWTAWFPGMREARWTSPPPFGVGSTRRVRVGPLTVDEQFIVWDVGKRWGFTFDKLNLPIARAGVELVELSDLGDQRTHVHYTMALDVPRPAAMLRPLLVRAGSAALARGLAGLNDHVRARR